jgi:hypothetical protein
MLGRLRDSTAGGVRKQSDAADRKPKRSSGPAGRLAALVLESWTSFGGGHCGHDAPRNLHVCWSSVWLGERMPHRFAIPARYHTRDRASLANALEDQ